MIQSRGYTATKYTTLSSAYYNRPTPLQIASYGVYVIDLIRTANEPGLQQVMELGLSPNACNTHGESILHNICRRGDVGMFDIVLQAGCAIQVSDDNGRTPLHDACWAATPNFPMVEKLLERDIRLLHMADNHGHLPLSFTRQDHWSEWLQFLESKKDVYWPRVSSHDKTVPPELTLSMPHSRPIPDPKDSLSLALARMVAESKLTPKEAYILKTYGTDGDPVSESDDDDDDDDSTTDSDSDSDDDSTEDTTGTTSGSGPSKYDDCCQSSWNIHEMEDIHEMEGVLESLRKPTGIPLAW
jgi:Ankyrin repeats (3 copies)